MTSPARIARILAGVDFDDASGAALRVAGALAAAFDATVTILHAEPEDVPAYFRTTQIEALEAERKQSRAALAERVRVFAGSHVDRPVSVVIADSPPQDAMTGLMSGFDLLVVGTHRRHGPRRWWLGSVAEAVVRRSAVPVLVAPIGAAIPQPARTAAILTVGTDAAAEAWADVLKRAFGGVVTRSPGVDRCTPDYLQAADLIVMSAPQVSGMQSDFGSIVQVLKECAHAVLFVPSADGGVTGRSS